MLNVWATTKFVLAILISIAIGGAAITTVVAGPINSSQTPTTRFQESDDDGTGNYPPVPRAVSIYDGTCVSPGDEIARLNSLRSPDGDKTGSDDADRAEYGYTPDIPVSIDDLSVSDHLILIRRDDDDGTGDDVLACGNIGGVIDDTGSLVVALIADDTGTAGVAVLSPSFSNSSMTQASIFLVGSVLGKNFGTDDDRDGQITDDDDNRGRDDDGGRGGDDVGRGCGGGGDDDGPGGDDDGGWDDDGPRGDDDGGGDDDDDGGDDDGGDD